MGGWLSLAHHIDVFRAVVLHFAFLFMSLGWFKFDSCKVNFNIPLDLFRVSRGDALLEFLSESENLSIGMTPCLQTHFLFNIETDASHIHIASLIV